MTMTPAAELIQVVLSEFQRTLQRNLEAYRGSTSGAAPRRGYVEQTEYPENAHEAGKPIAAWFVSPDAVQLSSIKEPRSPKIDGMFYDMLIGWFYFTNDLAAVHINWQIGPRYGRGFRHRIGRDTLGGYLLDRGTGTWIS